MSQGIANRPFLNPAKTMRAQGYRCRWWRVIGRNHSSVFEIGYFLAATARGAITRARREKAALVGGLRLEVEG
jgi:hypothetical protein